MPTSDQVDLARELIANSLVWDTHGGFMPDPLADLNNLQMWRDAGFDYISINAGFDVLDWSDAIRTISAFTRWIETNGDRYVLVRTVHDIHAARRAGKLAITFDLEGATALNGSIDMLATYHRLGVRQMLLAYNLNNIAAGGCHDTDGGLTAFGRDVVDEMNRLGMFVDLSHCGMRTTMDVMAHSDRPVIFSHSNPRALFEHERNITDEQIRACAAAGGLIGALGISRFLGGEATASTFADSLCYLSDLVGPEHVGIGLDYAFHVECPNIHGIYENNRDYWPPSQGYGAGSARYIEPPLILPVTAELIARGMNPREISGILGGNFLRLAAEIWR